ncbi:Histidinol-phosphate aminotransferase [Buchnera aphidicola (Cinara kochiana kochiana)]|uniref:Histidinol-phosphate aminotransferase n=1 Tax=Buchnera aphidicola (Cinara kochiana kochiana) TaxID=2518976 RepID=A0A451D565_9GAMM|nr:histidinol-phosphate transaminase [Buchnera aphidicola]VFP80990.1 Histidinol-phosphate aminotransferase [Buchnera aphidicola (Cinara kochiana kochiana)]
MKRLIPQHICALTPYQSARRIGLKGRIYLNANESPWINTVKCKHSNLNRYPDFQPYELLKKYSKYSGVAKENILITRGADEGIEILVRSFCAPNHDKIMFFPPTYDMYAVNADIFNIKQVVIPILSDFQLDLINIKKNIGDIKLIYICNPNNPTGNCFLRKDIISILKFIPQTTLLVIDEAYIEYSLVNSFTHELTKYTNLVILRTLSKAFGLASLRCGFVLSNTYIINVLKKVLAPYPIATPVSDIAVQSLKLDNIKRVQKNILKILNNKEFLVEKLKHLSCIKNIFPSNTNFILIQFFRSKSIFRYFVSHGIVIRDQSHKIGLKNCLRISIGKIDECQDLIAALYMFEGKKL